MAGASREGFGTAPGVGGLFWRSWDATEPRGRLLLLHGLGEHSGRYGAFAAYLASQGFSTFAFDLRGHGHSPGPRGDIEGFSVFLDDLEAMEARMDREVTPGPPTFLMGHSMGGLIALERLRRGPHPYRGALFSSPWLRTGLPDWLRALGRGVGRILPAFPFPNGISPARLTSDPAMMAAWKGDGLNHRRVTGRLFLEAERVQDGLLARPEMGDHALPLLFLVPMGDRVVRPRVTVEFAGGIVGKAIQVEILEGRAHEPLNDVGREVVHRTVAQWLEARLATAGESRDERSRD